MCVAAVRNCRCRSRNVRTGFMVHRCPPFRMEAHRSSAPQNELSLSLRLPIYHQSLTSEEGDIRPPPESAICPDVGLPRKRNWVDNVRMSGQRNGGRVMTEDGTSIHVRIDDEGHTHITVIQWDENGREIVYREDENFQCSEPQS